MKLNANLLNTIKYRVAIIMQENPETRTDDMLLIDEYKKRYFAEYTYADIFKHHKDIDFPSFESISRARRKVQQECKELVYDNVDQARTELTKEYINFARG